ncbi:MBL fold metallo-hydrolase [Megamonas hypermegale]|uniref:MBL fold metallo-hydrolase n=1 Tax=Megamonas hypermegale TaxID=158847 RepID=UPI00195C6A11|nr:MBL fold metallo-hydrolase [Megamonas hypermegale]MBM6832810.1 MBL fold metallo-hydrolase [Megamonas hypermegale]
MNNTAKITYLLNSGFVLEINDWAMIFDYYKDDNNLVPEIIKDKKEVYFFASHVHFDHFNPKINEFSDKVAKYFISYDIKNNLPPKDKTIVLEEYVTYEDNSILVKSFSSTDEGICFYIKKDGWKIFHAGDFNWWHWKGDTKENIAFARNGFKKQLKRMENLQTDIAFFPVDSRLEEFWDLGAREFCAHTSVKNLITMHNMSHKLWTMPEDFPNKDKISVWCPRFTGDTHIIKR